MEYPRASFEAEMPSSQKPAKERNSGLACLLCRKKKVKCDNGVPRCSNCRLYNSECVYGEDRRRRSFTSKSLKSLNNKVAALEARLAQHEPTLPRDQPQPDCADSLHFANPEAGIVNNQSIDEQAHSSPALHNQAINLPNPLPSFEDYDRLFEFVEFDSLDGGSSIAEPDGSTGSPAPPQYSALPPSSSHHRSVASPWDKSATHLQRMSPEQRGIGQLENSPNSLDQDIFQISRRFGRMRLTEGGHLRFFGATSYYSMLPYELTALYAPPIRNLREEGEAAVASANLRWFPDAGYEQHLENLFFAWHGPLLTLVQQDVYLREKEEYKSGRNTSLFSPALENAIFAIGGLYSERPHAAIHGKVSQFFGARARVIFEMEMDSPTIATTQAAVTLSSLEAASGNTSRGWIYSGIAVQMATDLGLHMPIASDEAGLDSAFDADALNQGRHGLFWSVYASNIYNSVNSGRPSSVKSMRCKAPTAKPPYRGEWKPFLEDGTLMAMPQNMDMRGVSLVAPYVVQIALKFERIFDSLYSEVPESSESNELFLLGMAKELDSWLTNLPEPLRWSSSSVQSSRTPAPIVLQLHMLFHEMRIVLFRAFLDGDRTSSQLDASEACTHSAEEVCRILQLYRRCYRLRYINATAVAVVMTAAEIHVHDCCTYSGQKGKIAENNLVICLQALGEMGQTFNSSIRGLDVVTTLRRLWQTHQFRDTRTKRPRDPFSSEDRQITDRHHRKIASSFEAPY